MARRVAARVSLCDASQTGASSSADGEKATGVQLPSCRRERAKTDALGVTGLSRRVVSVQRSSNEQEEHVPLRPLSLRDAPSECTARIVSHGNPARRISKR